MTFTPGTFCTFCKLLDRCFGRHISPRQNHLSDNRALIYLEWHQPERVSQFWAVASAQYARAGSWVLAAGRRAAASRPELSRLLAALHICLCKSHRIGGGGEVGGHWVGTRPVASHSSTVGVNAAERPPNMEELKGLKGQPPPSHHPSKINNEVFISSSVVEKSQVKFLRAAKRFFEAKKAAYSVPAKKFLKKQERCFIL